MPSSRSPEFAPFTSDSEEFPFELGSDSPRLNSPCFINLHNDLNISPMPAGEMLHAIVKERIDTSDFFDEIESQGSGPSLLEEEEVEEFPWEDDADKEYFGEKEGEEEESDDDVDFFEDSFDSENELDDYMFMEDEDDFYIDNLNQDCSRETVIHKLEQMVLSMGKEIANGEPWGLITAQRVKQKRRKCRKDSDSKSATGFRTRKIKGLSLNTVRNLAIHVKVIEIIHELLLKNIHATKRDIFYRDVALFGKQKTVDDAINDLSCYLNVPRSSLNVDASSKGLVYGSLKIYKRNGIIIQCDEGNDVPSEACIDHQGYLIPPFEQVNKVETWAKFVLVIEKEATFRYLISSGFCKLVGASCVLVTGKGYPDLATRQLVKHLSENAHVISAPSCSAQEDQALFSDDEPIDLGIGVPYILALVDGDPYGLDIFSCYRFGSESLRHEARNLITSSLKFLGITVKDRDRYKLPRETLLRLSAFDRKKGEDMLRKDSIISSFNEGKDGEVAACIRSELQEILNSDRKVELQALCVEDAWGLVNYLCERIQKFFDE